MMMPMKKARFPPAPVVSTAMMLLLMLLSDASAFSTSRFVGTGGRLLAGGNEVTGENNQVWVPPSQNIDQRRGNIFSIKEPEDLLDFVSEDERLCVGKLLSRIFFRPAAMTR
jgi:hypothetical protein